GLALSADWHLALFAAPVLVIGLVVAIFQRTDGPLSDPCAASRESPCVLQMPRPDGQRPVDTGLCAAASADGVRGTTDAQRGVVAADACLRMLGAEIVARSAWQVLTVLATLAAILSVYVSLRATMSATDRRRGLLLNCAAAAVILLLMGGLAVAIHYA